MSKSKGSKLVCMCLVCICRTNIALCTWRRNYIQLGWMSFLHDCGYRTSTLCTNVTVRDPKLEICHFCIEVTDGFVTEKGRETPWRGPLTHWHSWGWRGGGGYGRGPCPTPNSPLFMFLKIVHVLLWLVPPPHPIKISAKANVAIHYFMREHAGIYVREGVRLKFGDAES